jgi:hypothetical protein
VALEVSKFDRRLRAIKARNAKRSSAAAEVIEIAGARRVVFRSGLIKAMAQFAVSTASRAHEGKLNH